MEGTCCRISERTCALAQISASTRTKATRPSVTVAAESDGTWRQAGEQAPGFAPRYPGEGRTPLDGQPRPVTVRRLRTSLGGNSRGHAHTVGVGVGESEMELGAEHGVRQVVHEGFALFDHRPGVAQGESFMD